MADEVELISDGEGVVVVGVGSVVERFLDHAGLTPTAREFGLGRLSAVLRSGGELAKTASGIAEQSAYYLKLTPESARRLQDAGGLMKTKAKGISHAMLGDPGKVNKWLQVEDGPGALLTNPAVLSGVGGLMSQFAQQGEAQQLRALLVRMDEKLDDMQRTQRDAVLARLFRAAAAIDEAIVIREHGGDPATLWAKVSGESSTILEVQDVALLQLGALADKVDGKSKTGELKKATRQVERDVAIQLAILARCFELHDQFRVVELDHVLATAPHRLEGHRLGVAEARQKRRAAVLEGTGRIMERLDAAGAIVNANIILHARAARAVICSLNATAVAVDDFLGPLSIETGRDALSTTRWREALRDPQQMKKAGAEAGQRVVMAGGAAAALAVAAAGARNIPRKGA
jgi:hypothetical protein